LKVIGSEFFVATNIASAPEKTYCAFAEVFFQSRFLAVAAKECGALSLANTFYCCAAGFAGHSGTVIYGGFKLEVTSLAIGAGKIL
jgi:hypothetical protein